MNNKFFQYLLNEINTVNRQGAMSATIVMIYIAIDAMAFLSMPENRQYNTSADFIDWVNKYLKSDVNQPYYYTGPDIYAARCGKLHCFSAKSEYGKKHSCKQYMYHDGSDHTYKPDVNINLVMISVPRLYNDFVNAVQSFLKDILEDNNLKSRVNLRLPDVFSLFNIENY